MKNAETTPAWAQSIIDRLDRLEAHPTEGFTRAKQQAEFDYIWNTAMDIMKESDPAKRAEALMSQADDRVIERYFLHVCGDPQHAIDTVNELPRGDARLRVIRRIPPSLVQDMTLALLPAPKRVRLRLRDGVTAWRSSPIKGPRPSEDYRGVALVGERANTTEVGRTNVVMIQAVFDRACEIDAELTDAIRRGVVVVEEVSEEESRRLLVLEIAQLDPSERPRLEW